MKYWLKSVCGILGRKREIANGSESFFIFQTHFHLSVTKCLGCIIYAGCVAQISKGFLRSGFLSLI